MNPHYPEVARNKGGSNVTRLILRINTVLFNIVKSTRPASTLLASSLFSSFSFRLSKHCKHREGKGTGEGCKPSSLTRGSMLSETLVSGNDLAIPEPLRTTKNTRCETGTLLPHSSDTDQILDLICEPHSHPLTGLESACRRSALATHNTPKS